MRSLRRALSFGSFFTLAVFALPATVAAQPGTVLSDQKISEEHGDFQGSLSADDWFGWSTAGIGDLDGDGVLDVAVGAPLDDDGSGDNTGAIWILFLNTDGTVRDHQKISDSEGKFEGSVEADDQFGRSVTAVGDIDGDGIIDLAVGAPFDDDGVGENRGAVWILFMHTDGKVRDYQKISASSGRFEGTLTVEDAFGWSVAAIGDVDGDGFIDLAVGAPRDDDGPGADAGAVWILFLRDDGKVRDHQKISDDKGAFKGSLGNGDWFGASIASPDDLDGDGTNDLVIGAPFDNDGDGNDSGAVWVVFLTPEGKSKAHQKISDDKGNLKAKLAPGDLFGFSVGALGDFDRDGVGDVVVGAPLDDDGDGSDLGAVYILTLQTDGFVKAEQKISAKEGNFQGNLGNGDSFGNAVTALGDLDGDGVTDICVGAPFDNDGSGDNSGAVWNLFLEGPALVCGDADGNGIVSATDALIALNTAVGAADCDPCLCDVDSNGAVTATDSLAILNAGIGLDVTLTCPTCS